MVMPPLGNSQSLAYLDKSRTQRMMWRGGNEPREGAKRAEKKFPFF
jgi:hypothetical protein